MLTCISNISLSSISGFTCSLISMALILVRNHLCQIPLDLFCSLFYVRIEFYYASENLIQVPCRLYHNSNIFLAWYIFPPDWPICFYNSVLGPCATGDNGPVVSTPRQDRTWDLSPPRGWGDPGVCGHRPDPQNSTW